ncbi:MAG: hypothetical protein O2856_13670 [Planctomycetota bacterium]|nr:hypothetical protein [Planctomycetota bacterium]
MSQERNSPFRLSGWRISTWVALLLRQRGNPLLPLTLMCLSVSDVGQDDSEGELLIVGYEGTIFSLVLDESVFE